VTRLAHEQPYLYPNGDEPLAAIIGAVESDGKLTLSVLDAGGNWHPRRHVPLRQPDDEVPAADYAEWMPYQKSVAKGEIAPVLHAVSEPSGGRVECLELPAAD